MSGYTGDIAANKRVLNADVNFLQKPFSKAGLAAKIRRALNGSMKKGKS